MQTRVVQWVKAHAHQSEDVGSRLVELMIFLTLERERISWPLIGTRTPVNYIPIIIVVCSVHAK